MGWITGVFIVWLLKSLKALKANHSRKLFIGLGKTVIGMALSIAFVCCGYMT
jgi:hypothetical protein